jgi:hypothetical protein
MLKRNCFTVILFSLMYINSLLADEPKVEMIEIKLHHLLEISIFNGTTYPDSYRDTELSINLTSPSGRKIIHYGFYDGDQNWKVRFRPDENGIWEYEYSFSDKDEIHRDIFRCLYNDQPGRLMRNEQNPYWLGKGGVKKTLFRSFHVGDRFFATNWDDPEDKTDGNLREQFLNWLQENKYNMLSIASHYLNRDDPNRGRGWDTPRLWPLDFSEYRKMETIMDDLNKRDIVIFPFAGFFGAAASWPVETKEQELYIKYTLARIGHYPNIILSVAGPEPFWKLNRNKYQNSMRLTDVLRLGHLIDSLDAHGNVLTVHHATGATEYGDPFIDEHWYTMSTLQGPKTFNRKRLHSGLIMNHHRYKPAYAQETLWTGNKFHPAYSNEQIRKNVYTILFSGSILNFGDMMGDSSTGFTGSLNLEERNQEKHEIVKAVWDWFETIPFQQFISRQDLVNNGFCLASEGMEYFIYLDTIGEVELNMEFPYFFDSEWINAKNPNDKRPGPVVNSITTFKTPEDGDDWILHVWVQKPKNVATGNFPDIAVDQKGNIHIVYNRGGLMYRMYDISTSKWLKEQATGCACSDVKRSDPDIVIDSKGNPHVFCGSEYARFNGKNWEKIPPSATRDTELAIDSKDNIYLVSRAGYNGGYIGLEKINWSEKDWIQMTDPDKNNKGTNDHVYTDISIDNNNIIHLVQRHGPEVEVTYRKSTDGGKTWPVEENVMDEREEAPHIIATSEGIPFISTGKGFVLERTNTGVWKQHGRKLTIHSRMQPELGIDGHNNLYITSFGGRVNTLYGGYWTGEKIMEPVNTGKQVGFLETAGNKDHAYIIWEEGTGNPDEGLGEDSEIFVGVIYPDGRIVGLYYEAVDLGKIE